MKDSSSACRLLHHDIACVPSRCRTQPSCFISFLVFLPFHLSPASLQATFPTSRLSSPFQIKYIPASGTRCTTRLKILIRQFTLTKILAVPQTTLQKTFIQEGTLTSAYVRPSVRLPACSSVRPFVSSPARPPSIRPVRPSRPFRPFRPSVPSRPFRYVRPSVRPSIRPSVCPFVSLFVRPSIRSSVRSSVRPSVRPSVPSNARAMAVDATRI